MACGVPVIASRNPGNATWVREGETGQLFDVGDTEALADLLIIRNLHAANEASSALALARLDANWSQNRLRLGTILNP